MGLTGMARDFSRTDRVADAIQRELAQIIQREVKDPRVGMITIAEVKVSKDLAYAKIFVSVILEDQAQETVKALNRAAGFLRAALAKKVKIRVMPELTFIYDDTTLKANKLAKLIDEACTKDKLSANPDTDESSE
jgi:ribosome-binding factor A